MSKQNQIIKAGISRKVSDLIYLRQRIISVVDGMN